MIEIERKFLVTSEVYKDLAHSKTRMVQGFLNTHPERTVRIRVLGAKGFLTVKGKSNPSGTSRFEWEQEITVAEARSLLKLCEPGIIEKDRYEVSVKQSVFEVDEFFGNNTGLTVAEIELLTEDADFHRPAWLGMEVTGDERYYNSNLSKNPYQNWNL
ncbi:MAG: CYTH domain-containing protein [Bacteroidota bacterium]